MAALVKSVREGGRINLVLYDEFFEFSRPASSTATDDGYVLPITTGSATAIGISSAGGDAATGAGGDRAATASPSRPTSTARELQRAAAEDCDASQAGDLIDFDSE